MDSSEVSPASRTTVDAVARKVTTVAHAHGWSCVGGMVGLGEGCCLTGSKRVIGWCVFICLWEKCK